MTEPQWCYEHGSCEVDQAAGPVALLHELDEKSREGWECFQVMPMTRKSLGQPVSQTFILFLRRKKLNIVMPKGGMA